VSDVRRAAEGKARVIVELSVTGRGDLDAEGEAHRTDVAGSGVQFVALVDDGFEAEAVVRLEGPPGHGPRVALFDRPSGGDDLHADRIVVEEPQSVGGGRRRAIAAAQLDAPDKSTKSEASVAGGVESLVRSEKGTSLITQLCKMSDVPFSGSFSGSPFSGSGGTFRRTLDYRLTLGQQPAPPEADSD